MKNEITSTIYVSINGEYHQWDSLPKELQKEISIELNKRAIQALGYRLKDKAT